MPDAPTTRYAYLGPAGTFTQTALRQVPEAERAVAVPHTTVDSALDAVRRGDADVAVVPIENSVEGGVPATLDGLTSGDPLTIVREIVVPVSFVLAAPPGVALADVEYFSTHPHAVAQCRGWLAEHLPHAQYLPGLSTAAAAADLAAAAGTAPRNGGPADPGAGGPAPAGTGASGGAGVSYQAALCAELAAQQYGLTVLARDIGDNPTAVTRFIAVSRPAPPPAPTGADKTSIVAYQPADHPGGLLELLEQFSVRGINLVRIESRPTGDALGRYCFTIDAEGHVAEPRMTEALVGLHRFCAQVKFLGSYPSAEGRPVRVLPGTTAEAFTRAHDWVATILRDG